MGLESPSNDELIINCAIFFFFSVIFFSGRMINAIFMLKRIQIDDWLMCFFFFLYTGLLIFINVSAHYATNLFPPNQLEEIMADPQDVKDRILGSKIVIPLEQCMLASTWGVKACLLIFLYRMTNQMPRTRLLLWVLSGYVVIGYIVIQICYFFVLCRPFSQYYAMPVKNPECATYSDYSKIQMAFNISSDFFIILLPTTFIYRSGLPMKRKLLLMGLFSLGAFTIICAIMNKYYNFASPETTVYQLWYIREASVAMWVGNIICCWQLAQYLFSLRSFDDKHSGFQNQLKGHDRITEGEGKSIGGHTKNTTWYETMMDKVRQSRGPMRSGYEDSIFETEHEGGLYDENSVPLVNKGRDRKMMDNKTVFSLARLEEGTDAGPAIAYRKAQQIT